MSWGIFIKTKLTTKPINISCRVCQNKDLDSIVAIENLAYESPWSRQKFSDSLNNPNTLSSVILLDQQIAGYLFALESPDFVDILNICVHPKYQHQGLGRKLYSDFLQQVKQTSVKSILLEVRESNNIAISFYQSLGFEYIDTRKKYYSNSENAKILRLQII